MKSLIGKVKESNFGGSFRVIDYRGSKYLCKFLDELGYEVWKGKSCVLSGSVKNLNHPSVFGVGCVGEGDYKTSSREYRVWRRLCGHVSTGRVTLKEEEVFMLNFQKFCEWFMSSEAVSLPKKSARQRKPVNLTLYSVGDEVKVNGGLTIIIEKYGGYNNITYSIKGRNSGNFKTNSGSIKSGNVFNPYKISYSGVGYLGDGFDKRYYKDYKGVLSTWASMLHRVYVGKAKAYRGCSVNPEWHSFTNYLSWYNKQYKEEGWHVDKDILFKGNKEYGPNTCCIVPREINMFFHKRDSSRGLLKIGVTESLGKFKSQISLGGEVHHLGIFKSEEEAYKVYKECKEFIAGEMADSVLYKNLREDVKESLRNFSVSDED